MGACLMARARNIKPGFFRNADLAELPISARLLFIGLWTLADRAGRLADKPKQIKMEVYPADEVDVCELLDGLAELGLIQRYAVDGERFIQVTNFSKHQNPHCKEPASSIPALESTVQAQCEHGASTVQAVLIPDSGFLITDTTVSEREQAAPDAPGVESEPQRKTSGTPKRACQLPEDFEPDETATALAAELGGGVCIRIELPRFRDYHAARGKPMKDWQAAFRTWLRNARQFSSTKPQGKDAQQRAWLNKLTGRDGDAIESTARLVG